MRSRLLCAFLLVVFLGSPSALQANDKAKSTRRTSTSAGISDRGRPWTRTFFPAKLPVRFWHDATRLVAKGAPWTKDQVLDASVLTDPLAALHQEIERQASQELGLRAHLHFLSLRVFPPGRGVKGTHFNFNPKERRLNVTVEQEQLIGEHADPGGGECAVKVCVIPSPATEDGKLLVANRAKLGTAFRLTASGPLTEAADPDSIFFFLSEYGRDEVFGGEALTHSAPRGEPPRDANGAELPRVLIHGGLRVE